MCFKDIASLLRKGMLYIVHLMYHNKWNVLGVFVWCIALLPYTDGFSFHISLSGKCN